MDAWLTTLKAGVDAGYYRTESAEGEQESWPWQDKTCDSCPFWQANTCMVRAEYRLPTADTCHLFEPSNYDLARRVMAERANANVRRFWSWFRGNGGQPA